ncbi:MAG: hypothetical protein WCB68_06700 [Pyrinomonadaceae bacterium]
MQDQLKIINLRAPAMRLLLVVPVMLALVGTWFALRWYTGNTVAEYAPEMEVGGLETARSGASLAPDDPLTHFILADFEMKNLSHEQLGQAVGEYEEAVRLSPNDYRLWMSLGQAREQNGDVAGAERDLRHAVELAPAYAYPRWYLGNLLLRAGREADAFAELRRAGSAYPEMRAQVFNLAWQFYRGDAEAIARVSGDSGEERAQLALSFVGRGRVDEALKLWSGLSAGEKKEQRAAGAEMMKAALAAKHFRAALEIERAIAAEGVAVPNVGEMMNGGFEESSARNEESDYGWQLKSANQAQVMIDSAKHHQGAHSLRIVFNARERIEFNNASQIVVVDPSTQYRLECYVRTEDLQSETTPSIVVMDGADGSVIASSAPAPADQGEWQPVIINFKTSAKTEGVIVRIYRASCAETEQCPIFGTVWYDDFNLRRAGGNAGPENRNANR